MRGVTPHTPPLASDSKTNPREVVGNTVVRPLSLWLRLSLLLHGLSRRARRGAGAGQLNPKSRAAPAGARCSYDTLDVHTMTLNQCGPES
jgi:hypothetical protein